MRHCRSHPASADFSALKLSKPFTPFPPADFHAHSSHTRDTLCRLIMLKASWNCHSHDTLFSYDRVHSV
jgi:hypothetical protein